ncbi:MAG TPA: SDR family NAD(P)-dependent oxidoreductase [Acidimicrobiales bacterium]|nr:SDR family NAD(P)-dependent oxidoreductase [Acidimicrobiales bacterium]
MTGASGNGAAGVLEALFSVRGRRVAVTGAASGLGLAVSEVLAECGASVVLVDRDGPAVAAAAERLSAAGHDAYHLVADVGEPGAVEGCFDEIGTRSGGLDVVFANAGIAGDRGHAWSESGRLEHLDLEVWERVLRIDLTGVLVTLRAAARLMIPQKAGKMIVTVSVAGLRPDPMVGYPYLAAKSALANLVRHAALDLARHQITVMGIAPGPFRTNIGGKPPDAASERAWAPMVALGRMADPAELKGLALLLASPASSFMTGAVIPIDGGSSIVVPST